MVFPIAGLVKMKTWICVPSREASATYGATVRTFLVSSNNLRRVLLSLLVGAAAAARGQH
jgi:hypothetical protein